MLVYNARKQYTVLGRVFCVCVVVTENFIGSFETATFAALRNVVSALHTLIASEHLFKPYCSSHISLSSAVSWSNEFPTLLFISANVLVLMLFCVFLLARCS